MSRVIIKTAALLLLIAVSASGQLQQIASVPVPNNSNVRQCRVYGDVCFASQYGNAIHSINIINPYQPVIIGDVTLAFTEYLTIADSALYLSGGGSGGLYVINIVNPREMVLVNEVPTQNNCTDLEARGDYLYACDYSGGLYIYDISDRFYPAEICHITDIGQVDGIKLSENLMFVTCAHLGLRIFDISDPCDPIQLSFTSIPCGDYPQVTVDGDYAYFASYTDGYDIIDISDPTDPDIVNVFNPYGLDRGLEYTNGMLLCGNWTSGINLYDLYDPMNPTFLAQVPTAGVGTIGVAVSGHYAYGADWSIVNIMEYDDPGDGFYIIDREVEFAWEDITEIGEHYLLGDDEFTPAVIIGFPFTFYYNIYDSLFVCSNGFAAFNNYSTSYWNTRMPCDTQPNDIIAPFWDNFDPTGSPYNVYTHYFPDPERFVIQWFQIYRRGTNERENFEAILYPDGDIKFQYLLVQNATSATAGIESETGTRGTTFVHNFNGENPDSLAIAFRYTPSLTNFTQGKSVVEKKSSVRNISVLVSPNPFNSVTTINYTLAQASIVEIAAYNLLGQRVALLEQGLAPAGLNTLQFKCSGLSAGTYYININTSGGSQVVPVVYLP